MLIFSHFISHHGSLTRYAKLRVAHAAGMPGTFSPPPRVSDPGMHRGTCVTHVPWCMSGSLTSSFLWSRWRGKRSQHSWRMRNPQFCVSGKRPMFVNFGNDMLNYKYISIWQVLEYCISTNQFNRKHSFFINITIYWCPNLKQEPISTEDCLSGYRDSHKKDKTVVRSYYLILYEYLCW